MRMIFSRKGFDSGYGGSPSPILPDGSMASLPIPSQYGRPMGGMRIGQWSMAEIVSDLTNARIGPDACVHLDPDLQHDCVERVSGWLPTFGQVGSAQQHLTNQGVRAGDVFLFFGWFRQIERVQGRWRYEKSAPNIHSLFGWLQIGTLIPIGTDHEKVLTLRPWLSDHPHIQHATKFSANNTVYVASQNVTVGGAVLGAQGGGVFKRWTSALQLTEPGKSRSIWSMPEWMMPGPNMPAMTYHTSPERWLPSGARVRLHTVGKGQEFVLSIGQNKAATDWLAELIAMHAS